MVQMRSILDVADNSGARKIAVAMAEGPEAGLALMEQLELPGLDGPPLSLQQLLRAGRPLLLVFADPDCGPCIALAPRIAEWQRDHAADLQRFGQFKRDLADFVEPLEAEMGFVRGDLWDQSRHSAFHARARRASRTDQLEPPRRRPSRSRVA